MSFAPRSTEPFDLLAHEGECPLIGQVAGVRKEQCRRRVATLVQGNPDPIKAMMQGKRKLTKGHLPTMLKYVESSRQLVVSATREPTRYVEE